MNDKYKSSMEQESKDTIIKVYEDEHNVNCLCENLLSEKPLIVGFDTEVFQQRNLDLNKASLITINHSTEKHNYVYLILIYKIWMKNKNIPTGLQKLCGNQEIVKVGVGIDEDVRKLNEGYGLKFKGVVEIQSIALSLGYAERSLNELGKVLIPNFKPKKYVDGNWDDNLSEIQKGYASYDGIISREIYFKLLNTPVKTSRDIDEDTEFQLAKEWLINHFKNMINIPSKNSCISILSSSYGRWKKIYTDDVRKDLAFKLINIFYEDLKSVYKPVDVLTPNDILLIEKHTSNESLELLISFLLNNKVLPIKQSSLTNYLLNSYKPYQNLSLSLKYNIIEHAFNRLINTNKLFKLKDEIHINTKL